MGLKTLLWLFGLRFRRWGIHRAKWNPWYFGLVECDECHLHWNEDKQGPRPEYHWMNEGYAKTTQAPAKTCVGRVHNITEEKIMSIEGRFFTWTITAGEDLDNFIPGPGCLFKAVALHDGKLANGGAEAGGILLYGGKKGEHITLGYQGVMKFTAGAAIRKGKRLTVARGGYFEEAVPGDYVVGRCLDTDVSKGSIGTGAFNFANPVRET